MNARVSGKTRRTWLRFNAGDYVATKVLLGGSALASVLFGLGAPLWGAVNNVPLSVSYTTKVVSGIDVPRGATFDGNATVEVLLKDATLGERTVQALPGLLLAGLIVAVAWLLFQLLRDTQAKEPFTMANVRRIYAIALAILVGGLLAQYAQDVADNAIQLSDRLPDPSTLRFAFEGHALPAVVATVILLFGEAFHRGIELRDDVEGLV